METGLGTSTAAASFRHRVHSGGAAWRRPCSDPASMQRTNACRRWAYTSVEMVVVLGVLALVSAIAIRVLGRQLDRVAVASAVAEAAGAMARARDEALARRAMVSVRIDTGEASLAMQTRGTRIARHALGHAHGVSLATSRDSVVFDARGLGYGPANFTLVVRRGSVAETLVVSRLGRVRH